jgi:tetratricopeptide (TPR) repeat protein
MDVTAIQSVMTSLVGTSTSGSTSTSVGASITPTDVLDLTSSSQGTFSANLYSHLGDVARAAALAAASSRENETHTTRLTEASDALNQGDLSTAREIAQDLLKKNNQDAAAAHLMGRTYMAEKDYATAERWLSRAASLASGSSRFQSDANNASLLQKSDAEVLAQASQMVGDDTLRQDGIRLLGYLSDRSPDNAEAHLMLADALMDEGWVVPAVTSYENALATSTDDNLVARVVDRLRSLEALAPDIGVTHNLLGHALRKQGNTSEALAELQKAAELSPTNTNYQSDIGLVYGDLGAEALSEGKAQDAIRYYENAVEMNVSSDDLRSGLAQAHTAMSRWWLARGNTDKAFGELSAAKIQLPDGQDDVAAQIARAYNNLGDRYEKQGEWGWALASYRNAHTLDPDKASYRSHFGDAADALGADMFDEGDYEAAESYYQQAVDLFPGNDTYQAHLEAAQNAQ